MNPQLLTRPKWQGTQGACGAVPDLTTRWRRAQGSSQHQAYRFCLHLPACPVLEGTPRLKVLNGLSPWLPLGDSERRTPLPTLRTPVTPPRISAPVLPRPQARSPSLSRQGPLHAVPSGQQAGPREADQRTSAGRGHPTLCLQTAQSQSLRLRAVVLLRDLPAPARGWCRHTYAHTCTHVTIRPQFTQTQGQEGSGALGWVSAPHQDHPALPTGSWPLQGESIHPCLCLGLESGGLLQGGGRAESHPTVQVRGLEGSRVAHHRPCGHRGYCAGLCANLAQAAVSSLPPAARLTLPARGPCVAIHTQALPTDGVAVGPTPAGAAQGTAWPEEAPSAACG